MQKNEMILDAQKENIKLGHSRKSGCGSHSGIFHARSYQIGKTLLNKQQLRGRSRVTTFGDDGLCFYKRQTARGFTLIELLVVVLIIGILAAVALPQYNKAVYKARATQVIAFLNAYTYAADAWGMANSCSPILDENGDILDYGSSFSSIDALDIDLTSMKTNIEKMNPPDLGWAIACSQLAYLGDVFEFQYTKLNNVWNLDYCTGNTSEGESICEYLKQHLPNTSN